MKKQVTNPFLPLWEYIPDGEPHVFGDRIYLFGSHDAEGGQRYCEKGDYVVWSAPLDDLTDWQCHGVVYEASQDPRVNGDLSDLYAPDVVQGNDGRYYLYYGLSGGVNSKGDDHNTPIGVAVCDTPAGKYKYLGFVRNPDGSPFLKYLPADPAVINDDGVIRLYYGWALSMVAATAHGGAGQQKNAAEGGESGSQAGQHAGAPGAGMDIQQFAKMPDAMKRKFLLYAEKMLFHRSEEQLMADPEDVMGANHVVLDDDMLTVKSEPRRIVPSQFMALGTSFAGHGFYEASSIRKIGGTYYFIYSDENSNMLSYATSSYPDRDFTYRGILQSNGDVGLNGRKGEDRVNMTANNHGSLEQVNGQWYIFYHRQTHNSTYSRQACAEKVWLNPDGSIDQAECTSCGLNDGPLIAKGSYPAVIACNITNGHMPHATNRVVGADIPYITNDGDERFITNIKDGTRIGFKYFEFTGATELTLGLRENQKPAEGGFAIYVNEEEKGYLDLAQAGTSRKLAFTASGKGALYLVYRGNGSVDLKEISFD